MFLAAGIAVGATAQMIRSGWELPPAGAVVGCSYRRCRWVLGVIGAPALGGRWRSLDPVHQAETSCCGAPSARLPPAV